MIVALVCAPDPGACKGLQKNKSITQTTQVQDSSPPSQAADPKSQLQTLTKDTTIQGIKKRGTLKVALHKQDRPPFFMMNKDGKLIGIDIELAEDISKNLQVSVTYDRSADSFDGVVGLVESGQCDVAISKLSLTLERAQRVLYTIPYISLSKSVLLNRIKLLKLGENKSLEEIFSEKDSVMAVLDNSSYETFAKAIFPHTKVLERVDWDTDIIPPLLKGEVWGAFRDELEVRRAMFVYQEAALRLLAVNLKDQQDPIMMVIHRDAYDFKQWLDLYIEYVHKKETISHAMKRFSDYVYQK